MIKNIKQFEDLPYDTSELSQSILNIENKSRSNLFTWNGQFSPQFVEALIDKYSKEGDIILDPFSGSGTVLYEAGNKKKNVFGIEINPSAFLISKSYELINVTVKDRDSSIRNIEIILNENIVNKKISELEIQNILGKILLGLNDKISKQILNSFIVLLDFENKKLDYKILLKKWNDLKETILDLPYSEYPVRVLNSDARYTPLEENSIDLVITSPPYINVYNYHQQYRKSMEFLGYDILRVAQSEVGSNRKHRSNRFLTAIQYCIDIALVLKELSRVCRKDSRIIFVVGRESNIMKTSLKNSELVFQLGTQALGFDCILKQERVFKNRYGQMIYEDILHFKKDTLSKKETSEITSIARSIAKATLEKTLSIASSDEARNNIQEAISKVYKVEPSPMFELSLNKNNLE